MVAALRGRDQDLDRLAHEFVFGIAEHRCDLAVRQDDAPLPVADQHAIRRRLDDAAEPCFRFLELVLAGLQRAQQVLGAFVAAQDLEVHRQDRQQLGDERFFPIAPRREAGQLEHRQQLRVAFDRPHPQRPGGAEPRPDEMCG